MNNNIIKKLTSRKFIIAMITAITGIIVMCIGENAVVQTIAGAAMTIVPTVVYCIMEGVVDAKSIKTITEATADAAEKLGANEQTVQMIEQMGAVGEILTDDDPDEGME